MSSSQVPVARHKPHTPPPDPAHEALTIRLVLLAAVRWWKLVLPLGLLLAAAAGAAVYWTFVPQYEAVAWLRIDQQPSYLAFESRYEERWPAFVNTQIELLRSPVVLNPVVANPEVAQIPEIRAQADPVRWLAKQLTVKSVGESELFKVSLSTSAGDTAARVVNGVVDSYFKLRGQNENERVERVIKLLEDERQRRGGEVAALQTKLQQMGGPAPKNTPSHATSPGDTAARQAVADLQNRLISAEVEEELLKARIKAAEEAQSPQRLEMSSVAVEKAVDQNPPMLKLKDALAARRSKLREIEARAVEKDQEAAGRQLRSDIDRDEQVLAQYRSEVRQSLQAETLAAGGKKLAEELAALRSDLEGRRFAAQLLRKRYESQVQELKQPDREQLDLAAQQAELDRAEKVLDLIAERGAKLRTERQAPARVSLLQRSEVPGTPIEFFPAKGLALAVLAGLFFPLTLAVAWERLVRRINDPEYLERQSNLTLLAEVPRLPVRTHVQRLRLSRHAAGQLQRFEESVDLLRANLLLCGDLSDVKSLAVTSAVSGEGKSSVAAQLALSIAQASGEATLLIDGDMRAPAIHRQFGVALEPGLAQVLAGQCTWQEAIVSMDHNSLHVLPAGRLTSNPSRLLAAGALAALLAEAGARYHHLILDTSPLLATGEALMLAKSADACLICTMQGVSRMSQVLRARQRLEAAGGRLAGVVLNGVSSRHYAYSYGDYAYPRH